MSPRRLALICFFFSGATGLTYEVLWTRILGGTIGNTHFSITVVVSVFMGGLALGSAIGGRLADRTRRPLRLYGVLILLVGIACLLIPPAVRVARPLFAWLYTPYDGTPEAPVLLAVRMAFCIALLLVPTSFMGATLPVLARYFARNLSTVGSTVGRLYALNTFGALAGAVFTGFVGIPRLGLQGTNLLAVALDVGIAVLVFFASRGESGAALPESGLPEDGAGKDAQSVAATKNRAPLPAGVRLAVLAFALAGFANMLLQIAWTKAIVLTIGNSTYAFSLIVSLFILGIAIGGAIVSTFVDRLRNLPLALGTVVLLTGASVGATIPLLGHLPVLGARWFDRVGEPDYVRFLGIQIALISAVILPATVLMGTVFPIVGKIRTRAIATVGSAVGNAYFWNTAGSILGTLAAGFVFIPLFGRIHYSLYLGAAITIITGAALIAVALRASWPRRLATLAAILAAVVGPHAFFLPHGVLGSESHLWHPSILSQGSYTISTFHFAYDDAEGNFVSSEEFIERSLASNRIIHYEEGIHAPVAVVTNKEGAVAMRISGKVEASIVPGGGYNHDLPHQIMAGHLPMVLHPAPRDVVTLGLGGGVTLGTLTLYPVDSIDSLEISPEVIAAARDYFAEANRGAILDERVRNIIGDGRNHLAYTRREYDVITSVPSNPWIAGIGNLFTVEFFQTCRDRLRPDGIICNWIHKVNMRAVDYRTVVRTFLEVFGDHAQLWDLGYDSLLVGSPSPVRFDADRLRRLLTEEGIAHDLAGLGITDSSTFLRHFTLNADSMRRFVGDGPLNTDSHPTLEYSCPYGLYGYELDAFNSLVQHGYTTVADGWIRNTAPETFERARHLQSAFHRYLVAHTRHVDLEIAVAEARSRGEPLAARTSLFQLALAVIEDLKAIAVELRAGGGDAWLEERALAVAGEALAVPPGRSLGATLAQWLLEVAAKQTTREEGLRYVTQARPLAAESVETAIRFASVCISGGVPALARDVLDEALELGEESARIRLARGVLERALGNPDAAVAVLEEALESAPPPEIRSRILSELGFTSQNEKRFESALGYYEEALRVDPENDRARERLGALQAFLSGGAGGD